MLLSSTASRAFTGKNRTLPCARSPSLRLHWLGCWVRSPQGALSGCRVSLDPILEGEEEIPVGGGEVAAVAAAGEGGMAPPVEGSRAEGKPAAAAKSAGGGAAAGALVAAEQGLHLLAPAPDGGPGSPITITPGVVSRESWTDIDIERLISQGAV
jgi:hypothetical protein